MAYNARNTPALPFSGHSHDQDDNTMAHDPERREGVIYTFEGFLRMRLGGVWACLVSFAAARMLKATLVSAGLAAAVAGGVWLRFCGDAFRCDCVSAGLRCDGGWRAVAGILRGWVSLRLRFCGVSLSWRLAGCGCVSVEMRFGALRCACVSLRVRWRRGVAGPIWDSNLGPQ